MASDIDVEGAEEALQLNPPQPAALTATQIWPEAGSRGAESRKTSFFLSVFKLPLAET